MSGQEATCAPGSAKGGLGVPRSTGTQMMPEGAPDAKHRCGTAPALLRSFLAMLSFFPFWNKCLFYAIVY